MYKEIIYTKICMDKRIFPNGGIENDKQIFGHAGIRNDGCWM
jgi:hypothetical protein